MVGTAVLKKELLKWSIKSLSCITSNIKLKRNYAKHQSQVKCLIYNGKMFYRMERWLVPLSFKKSTKWSIKIVSCKLQILNLNGIIQSVKVKPNV